MWNITLWPSGGCCRGDFDTRRGMVEGILSFAAGFLPRSSPPAGEDATALRPTTDELTPSASTEVAARPADKVNSEEESAAAEAAATAEEAEAAEAEAAQGAMAAAEAADASQEAGQEAGEETNKVEAATAKELATLLAAGLEPREGVPGLFLCREDGFPIMPTDLEGTKVGGHY